MFRSSFTDSEWQTILFTPLWAFTAVAAADRKIDDKETGALAKELAEAMLYRDEFAREVLSAVGLGLATVMPAFAADQRTIVAGLQDAATILDAKLPAGAADGFKHATMLIALNVAKASGSVIGDKTSKEEKAAIGLVAAALRVPIPVG